MDDIQKLADPFRTLLKLMVDNPGDLRLIVIPDGLGVTFRVTVAEGDAGMLIGKQGRVARSLRLILLAISMKTKQKINLEIAGHSKR
jgi:uncharacterized protein